MECLPYDITIYTLIKDAILLISIVFAIMLNCQNIKRNNEINREKRRMEYKNLKDENSSLFTFLDKKEKKLPKKYFNLIFELNNNNKPIIYYDKGFFEVGWNWYINDTVIMLIEKKVFSYKYRVWTRAAGKWGWSEKCSFSGIKNDTTLKERIIYASSKKDL